AAAKQLYADGNYQEALGAFQQLLTDNSTDSAQLVKSFNSSLTCFRRLNRVAEIDDFREAEVERHARDWPFVAEVAKSYMQLQHYGYRIAGEFRRGQHRGGGKVLHATARDRVRALQLFRQALALLEDLPDQRTGAPGHYFLIRFAEAMLHGRNYTQAWRLQSLTDLDELPNYEEGWGYQGSGRGAPVTADGQNVYYSVPSSWEQATNDGGRWRWILAHLVEWQPQRRNEAQLRRAQFLQSQFGVQTLANYGWWFGRQSPEQDQPQETGTFALHTLGENETIARLATGIQRFELPDEHNHIVLLKRVLASGNQLSAAEKLATIYENRRQYSRAAEFWQRLIDHRGDIARYQHRLDQIVKNWGRFETVMTQPAGKGATVDFRYRNGDRVDFVARRIKVRQLLADVKEYLKSSPARMKWDRVQLENLGHRLVTNGQEKYLGAEVARWSLDLDPLADHFDRRITITTPLQEPGAYLLTSQMADGNTTSIVLWLSDTAIVKKQLTGKALYYVADAVSGKPLQRCNVEFFGFWQEHLGNNRYQVRTKNFASFTDENGLVELSADEDNRRHQWVAVATTPEGRFAYLGFRGVWAGKYYDRDYQQVKVFTITDRPVYRPEQPLHFKFWVRHAQYDLGDESRFAAQSFQVEIRDPKNEQVYSTQLIADAYGGLEGSWQIPAGATLGRYRINVVNHGGGSFRVEEYKKPEFEVTVEAPQEPVALGERVTATIRAKYYFGSPVTQATVKYKVLRTPVAERWYPP
ncbi:MAG: alpha-2-macroglobulin, partial [Planctomycetes bacterium]|nr:alpha-2-macroglobulin [Planctomycetota bacterium]